MEEKKSITLEEAFGLTVTLFKEQKRELDKYKKAVERLTTGHNQIKDHQFKVANGCGARLSTTWQIADKTIIEANKILEGEE